MGIKLTFDEIYGHKDNDNQIAINMLNCVSTILRGIESDNVRQINSAMDALKVNLSDFERVFLDNLINRRYDR